MKRARTDAPGTSAPSAKHPKARPISAWHGQETRPGPGGSETPEAAASRAEGNAPLPVEEALRRIEETPEEQLGNARSHSKDASDSDENVEEKREAAAEEHATQPSRRAPYGKL